MKHLKWLITGVVIAFVSYGIAKLFECIVIHPIAVMLALIFMYSYGCLFWNGK
jgi:hypothetical protein